MMNAKSTMRMNFLMLSNDPDGFEPIERPTMSSIRIIPMIER